jgi:hypothetical protein
MPIPELLRRLLARHLDLERPESAPTKHFSVVLKRKQRGHATGEGTRN